MFVVKAYYPDGVSRILATSGSNYIGLVDNETVLKFPHDPEELSYLELEAKIYEHLGRHSRILGFKGRTEHGLLLDFASNGRILRSDGSICVNSGVRENAKSRMPGKAEDEADVMTDIFAMGSTIYYIMQGHEPFPDLDTFADETVITERFASHQFPPLDDSLASRIVYKCWEDRLVNYVL
ncbi:uncharacterized protein MYCFIDRAFT_83794 [Pseudocercospora fijiensis CIRAD86]|uniref:Protein kinase domain-containing protein n=1 Tax=Pseudocercospora fijiensis (strain CIRAD86) TaxID=383855 RepID=M2YMA0_PSEFD|nr:uncharacterized protein MYCFIDRAFT_83794 [Pseudocercospora fijiensis CIRAD86]EME78860.1 hypothetical protein MYCFIDRAFT_83794 [Pseudocercospora fijiensis CIRAD86]